MFKLMMGFAVGYLVGAKLGEGGINDVLQIAHSTVSTEWFGDAMTTGSAILSDAVRTVGTALKEELPARLGERVAATNMAS